MICCFQIDFNKDNQYGRWYFQPESLIYLVRIEILKEEK